MLWRSAPMTRPESTGPLSIVSRSSSAPTGPQPRGRPRPAHRHRLCAARDGGRILVTELSMLCLPVVAEMSRARWPSSPTARSCGCLHRGSNAQAVSKAGEATRSHVPMASASCVARRGRSASRRAHSWGRRGSGRRACTCSMCTGLSCARAQRQGRPKAARPACVAACRARGTPAMGRCPWSRRDW